MLRKSIWNEKKLTYEILEGVHDFNICTWIPPGTKATIHKSMDEKST